MHRILVADDQSDVVESLRLLLKREGFDVDGASSPQAVLETIRSRSYDVLLLDMNYARDTTSGGEGLELLSEIHRLRPSLPVVMMTAWSSVDLAVRTMRTGGCDFVEKPWDNENLLATLRRNIEEGRKRALLDLEEAYKTQQRLLPSTFPRVDGIEIQAAWLPAATVGGDYFDAIKLDDNTLAFCIADVSGKGLPAALLASNLQATVRAFAATHRDPSAMCRELNRVVASNTEGGRHITFFYGLLNSHELAYTNAGHVPPILLKANAPGNTEHETLVTGGAPLGILPGLAFEQGRVSLERGDHLILLTDGITEAENASGLQFKEAGNLDTLLQQNRRLTSEQLKNTLLSAVKAFAGERLQDDAAVMIVSRLN
jgi:sigma-B regulation protein RsbU (phosphoserine phosphatase)